MKRSDKEKERDQYGVRDEMKRNVGGVNKFIDWQIFSVPGERRDVHRQTQKERDGRRSCFQTHLFPEGQQA